MTRVKFLLTMPSRGSWNGEWSGDGHNYTLVRDLEDDAAEKINGHSWSYIWSDGWIARVRASIVSAGKARATSDGFCGYDWMVDSILRYGKIFADHERPGLSP